ncbi:C2H2 and C2HC zinc fingers superfamily protein [Actinidia rufa]|uniref:C2H2 and C2HC zinc fingers superfamily protein n=1 Tax=Actinidia rufa TaxID=165716 RepID=A0A7J0DNY4_9ERIC|nr:C2H2 and C2HC zinc fingers superfamily protein [Actinidia rufa]
MGGSDKCPSDASSISAAFDRPLPLSQPHPRKDNKMKMKMMMQTAAEGGLEGGNLIFLTLTMSILFHREANRPMKERSGRARVVGFSLATIARENSLLRKHWGGHQNAHKQERTMAKKRQEMEQVGLGPFGHLPIPYPYYSYNSPNNYTPPTTMLHHHHVSPLYGSSSGFGSGSYTNRSSSSSSLGVRMDQSMIHKPSPSTFPWSTSTNVGQHKGWSSSGTSAYDRLRAVESFHSQINGGFGGPGPSRSSYPSSSSSSRFEGNGGAVLDGGGYFGGTKPITHDGGDKNRGAHACSEDDASGIDLNLKL